MTSIASRAAAASPTRPWPADRVEQWPIERLIPYANNPRLHSAADIERIAASILKWGWTNPVLVDEHGVLIAGHGRVAAAAKLGLMVPIPVIVARGWSAEEKQAYRLADNEPAVRGSWDPNLLRSELGDLKFSGFDLERERLLAGNWKIRPAAGLYFKREWCAIVDHAPVELDIVRYWDLAATEKTEFNDPDWTVGVKLGRDRSGGYWLLDMVRVRANPGDVERLLVSTAEQDGKKVRIGFGKDPGQAGKSQALHLVRALGGFTVTPAPESGDKLTRFGPFSSQCCAGNVKIRRGSWNEELFRVLEGFPDLAHDDEVDACSGALEMLNPNMNGYGLYELYRREAERSRNRENPERPFHHRDGQPGLDRCRVRLRAPPGVGAVQTFSGQHLTVGRDGTVEMWAADAQPLIPAGWTKLAERTPDEDVAAERSKPQPAQTLPQPGSMEWFEAQKKKG